MLSSDIAYSRSPASRALAWSKYTRARTRTVIPPSMSETVPNLPANGTPLMRVVAGRFRAARYGRPAYVTQSLRGFRRGLRTGQAAAEGTPLPRSCPPRPPTAPP